MSRAFVREDDGGPEARHRFPLPPRDDPGYPRAAALALLAGANQGDSLGAEEATGFRWGDARMQEVITAIRNEAIETGDDRLEVLADRFLRAIDGNVS